MTLVEENAGKRAKSSAQLLQLAPGFDADQSFPTAGCGIPHEAAMFGHSSAQRIGLAIALHFGNRTRGVHNDGIFMGRQHGESFDSSHRGARKSQQPSIDDAVDIERYDR